MSETVQPPRLPARYDGPLRPYHPDPPQRGRNPWPKRWLKATRGLSPTIDLTTAHGPMRCLRADITIAGKYMRTGQWHGALDKVFGAMRTHFGAGDFDLVVNIGANNGCSVLPLVAHGFARRAIAFEPEPTNAGLVRHNVHAHGLDANITLVPAALAATAGTLEMQVSPTNKGAHRLGATDALPDGWARVVVPLVRLDDVLTPVLSDLAPGSVLTWMDIQGAEALAIAGGDTYFARFPLTVTEFDPTAMQRLGAVRADVLALFARHWTRMLVSQHGQSHGDWTLQPISALGELWDRLEAEVQETDIILTRD